MMPYQNHHIAKNNTRYSSLNKQHSISGAMNKSDYFKYFNIKKDQFSNGGKILIFLVTLF